MSSYNNLMFFLKLTYDKIRLGDGKMEKEQESYNKKIYKDSIALLIASIISFGFAIWGAGYESEAAYALLLKSILYIILLAVIVKKSKNSAHEIINFGIVTSIIMIIGTAFGPSMFDLMILPLSIFFLIHLISYKTKFKYSTKQQNKQKEKTDKKEYIKIIILELLAPVVIFVLTPCVALIPDSIFESVSFSVNLVLEAIIIGIAIIMNIISFIKCKKIINKQFSAGAYTLLIISIIGILVFGIRLLEIML